MQKFKNALTVFLFIFSIIIFIPIANVHADDHRLDQLFIHTYIHSNGSATISEYRNAHLTEGTENYDVIENLGKSQIFSFEVGEHGLLYEYIEDWNINATREEKTFKNSILKTDDGYELVWGIGEYGHHEYHIRYVVTDFIKQLEDSQILFWRFINDEMNTPPKEIVIVIETERPLSNETEKIWGFGFEGNVDFEDGVVVARNEEPLDTSNYATILIQFPDGEFATGDILNKTFAEVREGALDGSDYGKRDDSMSKEDYIFLLLPLLVFAGPVIIVIYNIRKRLKESKRLKKIRKSYKGQYNRELPYKRNFIEVFFILQNDRIAIFNQLINAYLLKWIKEERVSITVEKEKGVFSKSKETLHLYHVDEIENIKNEYERRLFTILVEAAGENGKLEKGGQWEESLQKKFGEWKEDVSDYSRDQLIEKGYLEKKVIHGFSADIDKYEIIDKGKPIQAEIYQFINYLEDFSLIEERESIDVAIWDDLLMWAALLGMAPIVEKQFKKMYPDYMVRSVYQEGTINATQAYAKHLNYNANFSQYGSGEVASLGGGGSTSVGGGGGSFGGGSGGGTR